jgi:hypothetical protein
LFVTESGCVDDPSQRTQCKSFWFFPFITHNVVPLLKNIGVEFEIAVLRPSCETLDLFETKLEITHDLVVEILSVRLKLDPEFVSTRESLLVQLYYWNVNRFCVLFFFLFAFWFDLFDFQVAK